jgi:hypothetical protein
MEAPLEPEDPAEETSPASDRPHHSTINSLGVFLLWATIGLFSFSLLAFESFGCGFGGLSDTNYDYTADCTSNNHVSHAAKLWALLPASVYLGLSVFLLATRQKWSYLVVLVGTVIAGYIAAHHLHALHQHIIHVKP